MGGDMNEITRWVSTLIASVAALLGLAQDVDTVQPRSDAACQAAYAALAEQQVFEPPAPEPEPQPDGDGGDADGDTGDDQTEDAEQVGPSHDAENPDSYSPAPVYRRRVGPLRRLFRGGR